MSKTSPWADIETPGKDYNVRKVPETNGVPLYWGRDKAGHCLFIIELSGDQSDLFRRQHVRVQGIRSDLRLFGTKNGTQGMVITLEKHVDQDIFAAMCQTLIAALRDITDSATGLSVALAHVKRWKAFMAGKRRGILSPEEVRGLFGELTFLGQVLKRINEQDALNSWGGPESVQQDFILGDMAVEVKTLSGRERNSIRISSEDQLYSTSSRLYLKLFRISEISESDRAVSLNDLVKRIAEGISDHSALELFYDKLAVSGYVELPEYDSPEFVVSEERLYCVNNDFPRLIRSELPNGVSNVRYGIDLESIKTFLVRNDILWGKQLG